MKRISIAICTILFVLFMSISGAQSIDNNSPGPAGMPPGAEPEYPGKTPVIKLVKPGVFEIGGIRLDKKAGTVEFEATVNMNKGLLEYLLVEKSGKVHESLLRTDVEPFNLQIALLMLGLEGTQNPLREQGDQASPEGDPVQILVKWIHKTKSKTVPVEKWIYTDEVKKEKHSIDWVFTGSIINNGTFMAQADKSIIALYHDPIAMFDNKMAEGGSDEVWFADEKTVPENGTNVILVIKKLK